MAFRISAHYGKFLEDDNGKLRFVDAETPNTVWKLEEEADYVRIRSARGNFIAMNESGDVKAIDRLNPNTRFVLVREGGLTAFRSHTHKNRYIKATPDHGVERSEQKKDGETPGPKSFYKLTPVATAATAATSAASSSASSGPKSVKVTIESAENLPAADSGGTSDPFCRLAIGKPHKFEKPELDGKTAKKFKEETKVVPKSLHPRWNETFTLAVRHVEFQALVIDVMDKNKVGSNTLLGRVVILLKDLKAGETSLNVTLRFAGAQSGHAALKLKVTPQGFP